MCIQRQKANEMGIEFNAKFMNMNGQYLLESDEHRIMQVILNLQSNALKFTESGKVNVISSIFIENEKQYLKIDVEDTGIGIKQED